MVPKKLGLATLYLGTYSDANGLPLEGDRTYRFHVPPYVPAKQFWALTEYDVSTAAFTREAPKVAIDSCQNTQKNVDGSADVYFGPVAPGRQRIQLHLQSPGKHRFKYFRFYGPERPVFDKTWKLPDVEQTSGKQTECGSFRRSKMQF